MKVQPRGGTYVGTSLVYCYVITVSCFASVPRRSDALTRPSPTARWGRQYPSNFSRVVADNHGCKTGEPTNAP